MPDLPAFPVATMWVEPWPDAVIDQVGYDPRSEYVERFWLSLLGPSATWLVRRLAAGLDARPEGFELDLPATALELGLGIRSGRHSPFMRTIDRCARFGALAVISGDQMRARRKLPPLTRHQHERLPAHLQAEHQALLDRAVAAPNAAEHRERARGMALAVAVRDASVQDIEAALHQRGIHPSLAHDAATWAIERRSAAARADEAPPAA